MSKSTLPYFLWVQVVVRCRPLLRGSTESGHNTVVEVDELKGVIRVEKPGDSGRDSEKIFLFDDCFGPASKQSDVYEYTARQIVDDVLDGYNGTIFAYGQTGSGKTYTMEGVPDNEELRGVMPTSFFHIFDHIAASKEINPARTYLVKVSFCEIYQEDAFDLLDNVVHLTASGRQKLQMAESKERGVHLKGLVEEVVEGPDDVMSVLKRGQLLRRVGETQMNCQSSRSHSLLTLTLEIQDTDEYGHHSYRVGKLNMVDLAGSERQKKSGSTGQLAKEMTAINLSLTALGKVIRSLADPSLADGHIPYRDSLLTRLLKDSLGGNTKTVMVANLGPSAENQSETLCTLRYANRVKNIKNQPRINDTPFMKDMMLRARAEEEDRLKRVAKEHKRRHQEEEWRREAAAEALAPRLKRYEEMRVQQWTTAEVERSRRLAQETTQEAAWTASLYARMADRASAHQELYDQVAARLAADMRTMEGGALEEMQKRAKEAELDRARRAEERRVEEEKQEEERAKQKARWDAAKRVAEANKKKAEEEERERRERARKAEEEESDDELNDATGLAMTEEELQCKRAKHCLRKLKPELGMAFMRPPPHIPGLLVGALDQGKSAMQCGLKRGDVLQGMNQHPVATKNDVVRMWSQVRAGDTIMMKVLRLQDDESVQELQLPLQVGAVNLDSAVVMGIKALADGDATLQQLSPPEVAARVRDELERSRAQATQDDDMSEETKKRLLQQARDEFSRWKPNQATAQTLDPAALEEHATNLLKEQLLQLTVGAMFMKHARGSGMLRGKDKHKRFMFYSGTITDGVLYWCKENQRKRSEERSMSLREITAILVGKQTEVFKRPAAHTAPNDNCFSIVVGQRSLDLEAVSRKQRDDWVTAITNLTLSVRASMGKDAAPPPQAFASANLKPYETPSRTPVNLSRSNSFSGGAGGLLDRPSFSRNSLQGSPNGSDSSRAQSPKKANGDALRGIGSRDFRTAPGTPSSDGSGESVEWRHHNYTQTIKGYVLMLKCGAYFVKHANRLRNSRTKKFVFYIGGLTEGRIFWSNPNTRKTDEKKSLKISEIQDIRIGKSTRVFLRGTSSGDVLEYKLGPAGSPARHGVPDDLCMSIFVRDRSLDLEAESVKQRDEWFEALRALRRHVLQAQMQARNSVGGRQRGMGQTQAFSLMPFEKAVAKMVEGEPGPGALGQSGGLAEEKAGEVELTPSPSKKAGGLFARMSTSIGLAGKQHSPSAAQEQVQAFVTVDDPAKAGSPDETASDKNQNLLLLRVGAYFYKHGGRINPRTRKFVFYTGDAVSGTFWWCRPDERKEQKGKCINLGSISDIYIGKHTPTFAASKEGAKALDSSCFSIGDGKQTVDLECDSTEQRDDWVTATRSLIFHARKFALEELNRAIDVDRSRSGEV